MEFCDGLSTADIFRKWSAISCVAGALERKVWVRSRQRPLYPNLYCLLVGGPGTGKTVAIQEIENMWLGLETHKVAPTTMTKAALVDKLAAAKRSIVRPGEDPGVVIFHSLLVPSPEWGALVPAYDTEFMNNLTDLYDCRSHYTESIRSRADDIKIPNPQLHIIGGTTPHYLQHVLPEVAWGQGITSRQIMVYSGENIRREVFSEAIEPDPAPLIEELKIIGNLFGQVRFEEAAAKALEAWNMSGGDPQPEHAKLIHYNTRRVAHVLKLCIIASTSRSNDLIITLDDYQRALSWLTEAEEFMPDIFKVMSGGGDSAVLEDTWHYLWSIYGKKREPIGEARIMAFIGDRAPSHSVERILDLLVKTERLKVTMLDDSGRQMYTPQGKIS